MSRTLACRSSLLRQAGLTLVEMMVSITISLIVLSGVVQVLVVSKSNFVTVREMAAMQENARFALKYMTDEIRMAGYSGCASPLKVANSVSGSSTNWYLDVGLRGYEYDAGVNTYPTEFRTDVRANTDALAIRRGDSTGLRVSDHNPNSAQIDVNIAHSYKPGQILMIANPDCEQVGIFQMSGPANTTNNATNLVHNTGASISPGNCTKNLRGAFTCTSGTSEGVAYDDGATIMELHSEAFYVGNSEREATVPALFRERMLLNTTTSTPYTTAEELVEGVENLQVLYGLDNSNSDGLADIYMKANDAAMNWNNVVTVRLTVRMRSVYPIYNTAVSYDTFEGVSGTGGADTYMRQTLTSTIAVRN